MKNSIVYRLLSKPLRFEELKRALPEMSKQDLIAELEALGEAGLILRNKKNRYAHAEHFTHFRRGIFSSRPEKTAARGTVTGY